jgi:hypothetical protein
LEIDVDESTHTPGKRCTKCGVVKPITEFTQHHRKSTRRKSYWRSTCRQCNSEHLREYTRERREFLEKFKLDHGCLDCGYAEHSCALDFDHRPGEVKLFEPSELKSSGSWQQMLDEIAKCDVVCSNCHRVRTFSRPPANAKHDLLRAAKEAAGPPDWRDPYMLDIDQLSLFPPPRSA